MARAVPPKPSAPSAQTASPSREALHQQAVALFNAQDFARSEAATDQLLARWPDATEALNLKGTIAVMTQRRDQAEALWRRVLALQPGHIDAATNLGLLMHHLRRSDQTVALLEPLVAQYPEHVNLHLNLGVALTVVGRRDAARRCYERCLALQPVHAQAQFNLARLLQDAHDFAGAHEGYRRALTMDPRHAGAHANLVFTQHYVYPFDPAANRDDARRCAQALAGVPAAQAPAVPRQPLPPARPLRVGFVSADLRTHPVGYFLEAVLGHLDPATVQLVAYANTEQVDDLTRRLQPRFEAWRIIENQPDAAVAERIRADGIDVLVDLSGLTAGHRQGLFALKPAPVQVTWLGYFSTTGLAAIDYVLADPVTVPPSEEGLFVEQVWRLPVSRFCFTPPAEAGEVTPLPALRRGHVTFGCYQALPKVNDAVIGLWGRIMSAAPQARLRLQSSQMDDQPLVVRLRTRLEAAGIAPDRVDLIGRQSRADYLASHAEVDLVLDTFPYPGGTTTAEALWMGVPTLTLAGPGMLGRQGEGMLRAVGLDDWVTSTPDDYVARAVRWGQGDAGDLQVLAALRAGLREQARASALFDAPRFARDLQAAWLGMFQRQR